jgi:hypothetical protein
MSDQSMTAPGGPVPTEPNSGEPQPIDGPRALQLLREVVAERPGYVYKARENDLGLEVGCVYQWKGEPSCVVARVLHRAGYSIDLLRRLDGMGAIRTAASIAGLAMTTAAVNILAAAQDTQDTQVEPWSRALDAAEREAQFVGVTA